jgi:hypothetical protein
MEGAHGSSQNLNFSFWLKLVVDFQNVHWILSWIVCNFVENSNFQYIILSMGWILCC